MPSITIDLHEWDALKDKILTLCGEDAPIRTDITRRIGEAGCQMIVDRTLLGNDKMGQAFVPYSGSPFSVGSNDPRPDYFAIASGAGGIPSKSGDSIHFPTYKYFKDGVGDSAEPNLMVSGAMMGAKGKERPFGVTESDQDSVTIGFNDALMEERMDMNISDGRDAWGVAETENEAEALGAIGVKIYQDILDEAFAEAG